MPGTYIFVGPPELGKATFVRTLASYLLEVPLVRLGLQPEFFFLERLTDEKTDKRKRELTIEQARDLKRRMAVSSWTGRPRIALIDGADTLNEEASNALLKLFEEPNGATFFFLTAHYEQNLLPTIRSRAQIFHWAPVAEKIIADGLVRHGITLPEAQLYARIAWGRPGRALRLAQNPEARDKDQENQKRLATGINEPWFRHMKYLEDWLGKGEETRLDRDELDESLAAWTMYTEHDLMRAQKDDCLVFARRISAIEEARALLRRQGNPKLVLAQLLVRL